jgi:predicted RecA/RadA family phage recombinase
MNATRAILTHGVVAAVAMSAHRAISYTGAIPAAGGPMMGVTISDASAGNRVPVEMLGISEIAVGAAVAAGAALELDATGRAVTLAAGTKIGRAMASASAADQVILFNIIPS